MVCSPPSIKSVPLFLCLSHYFFTHRVLISFLSTKYWIHSSSQDQKSPRYFIVQEFWSTFHVVASCKSQFLFFIIPTSPFQLFLNKLECDLYLEFQLGGWIAKVQVGVWNWTWFAVAWLYWLLISKAWGREDRNFFIALVLNWFVLGVIDLRWPLYQFFWVFFLYG